MKSRVVVLSKVRPLRFGFCILILLFALVAFTSLFAASEPSTESPITHVRINDGTNSPKYASVVDIVRTLDEISALTNSLEKEIDNLNSMLQLRDGDYSLYSPESLQQRTHSTSLLHDHLRSQNPEAGDKDESESQADPSPSPGEKAPQHPFLLVAIPTMRRQLHDYLSITLDNLISKTNKRSVETQVNGGNDIENAKHNLSLRVLVVNNDGNERTKIRVDNGPIQVSQPDVSESIEVAKIHLPFYQNLSKYCGVVDEIILKFGEPAVDKFTAKFSDMTPHLPPCKKYALGRHYVYYSPDRMVLFAKNNNPIVVGEFETGDDNRPNSIVQQQSRDFSDVLSFVSALFSETAQGFETVVAQHMEQFSLAPSQPNDMQDAREAVRRFGVDKHLVLLTEDDFKLCNGALPTIGAMIARANASFDPNSPFADEGNPAPGWNGLRMSYGYNGVVIHDTDLLHFANYLVKHIRRRPPDHLLDEWMAGETDESNEQKNGRLHLASKRNLFSHLGSDSTLRGTIKNHFPGCNYPMNKNIVFEIFVFNTRLCEHDIISPCLKAHDHRYKLPGFPSV